MFFPARSRIGLILSITATTSVAISSAQTLQKRPEAKPAQSPAPFPGAPVSAATSMGPELPDGTSLQVEISRNYPMKAGEAIEGRLMHPLFANGKLVVPENTAVHGRVVGLESDPQTRLKARLRGDFTPFHKPEVQFDELILPNGSVTITAAPAADGAPVLHLTALGASPKQSFLHKRWGEAKSNMHDRTAYFTAPGKGDRALQMLYHQLPYHPERIEAHTTWSFELTSPVNLPAAPAAASDPPQPAPVVAGKPETWQVSAVLLRDLTSASARSGDPVQALVVEPVYDRNTNLVVPQGSTLVGKVTAAEPARSFGRNGKLRFTFQQVRFPEGFNRLVEGSLAGAATEKTQNLQLDAEGTISPRNQSSAVAPILLTLLAGRALDRDGSMTLNSGVASNGFGLIGRIVGVAASNRNLAAGIGFYAAGLSFYDNFLRSGRDVVFPKDTRIEIETTPQRAPVLTPGGQ